MKGVYWPEMPQYYYKDLIFIVLENILIANWVSLAITTLTFVTTGDMFLPLIIPIIQEIQYFKELTFIIYLHEYTDWYIGVK